MHRRDPPSADEAGNVRLRKEEGGCIKVIIAGTRSIWRYDLVEKAINESGFDVTTVVCGMAPGIDSVGWAWAYINGVPIDTYHAKWGKYGNAAGPMRNSEMAINSDALIAITNGSPGTADMIDKMITRGRKVYVFSVQPNLFE